MILKLRLDRLRIMKTAALSALNPILLRISLRIEGEENRVWMPFDVPDPPSKHEQQVKAARNEINKLIGTTVNFGEGADEICWSVVMSK